MKFSRLTSASEITDLIKWHNQHSQFVVLDTETTSKEPRKAHLIDIQLSGADKESAVIFGSEFAPLLLDIRSDLPMVAHNYPYDAHVLYRHSVDLLRHTWRDTLLIGHLIDENRESRSLDSYVQEHWNDSYKEVFWSQYQNYQDAPEDDKVTYSCKDILYTGRLYEHFLEELALQEIPDTLVDHVHRLQRALLYTEIAGVRVDLNYLQELGIKLQQRINELGPEMREFVRDEIEIIELELWDKALSERKSDRGKARVQRPTFSFQSTKQLQNLLYNRLGLPPQFNQKTKAISTDYDSLEKIKEAHPVVKLIQEDRELQKVYSAYVTGTLDRIDEERIYPQFNVAGPVTGRISSNSPNLQQLPKSGGVRAIYVPDPGRGFISADYDQLEVVVEANLTGDKNLIRMLENGESKHDLTARELGCSRDIAKTLNFALQYWASSHKIAKLLGVSGAEGLAIYNKYWSVYQGPKRLKEQTDKMVDRGEPLVNLFGRKRRFGVAKRQVWDSAYRQAYNFLIQSTGADLTSRAFYLTDEWLRRMEYGKGLFTVHDELIIEVIERFWEHAEKGMLSFMTQVGQDIGFKIPLRASSSGLMSRWED